MSVIDFQIVQSADRQAMLLIAGWYFSEWHIPVETPMERLQDITADRGQFQVLMLPDGRPVSTGGIYDHVGLLDKEPGFKIYKKWLARWPTIQYHSATHLTPQKRKLFKRIHLFFQLAPFRLQFLQLFLGLHNTCCCL